MKLLHENKVERFYSHGSDTRRFQEGGFLSFGLWTNKIIDYHQAAEALIGHVLKKEKALHGGVVLNVACGYGAETLKIFEIIKPDKIIAIDITDSHIEYGKLHMHELNLADRIQFIKMDACKLEFQPESFDYIIGIEGPAHFNTREIFFRRAFEVLKPKGVLLLSDIIVDNEVAQKTLFNRIIGNFCAKHWFMPKANWMSIDQLRILLTQIGFIVDTTESVGEQVYPGFSHFNLKWSSIKNAMRTRGIRIGLALTFISWLLGYVHRRKMIDYMFLRAIKP